MKYLLVLFLMFAVCLTAPGQGYAAGDGTSNGASNEAVDYTKFSKNFPAGTPALKVATGMLPIKYLVDRVGGEYVDTIALLPPGADPHTYEPKVSQLAILNDVDLYFNVDSPFEMNWLPRFTAVNKRMEIIDLVEHLFTPSLNPVADQHDPMDKTKGGSPNGGSGQGNATGSSPDHTMQMAVQPAPLMPGEHSHNEHDPHVWLSPVLLSKMAESIAAELSRLLPEYQLYFEKNLQALQYQLEELDASIKQRVDVLPDNKKVFLVFHPSWGYFAEEYGLTQIAVELEGKEPTPASLAKILDQANNAHVSVIFVQKEFNPAIAQTAAAHLPQGKVVVLDPLGYNPLTSIREAAAAIVGPMADPDAQVPAAADAEAEAGAATGAGADAGI